MKKFLLFSALAFAAISANADYSDYYKVYYQGEEIENGATINAEMSIASETLVNYEANITFVSEDEFPMPIWADEACEDPDFMPALCYANAWEVDDNCITPPYVVMMPGKSVKDFQWQLHLMAVTKDVAVTASLTTKACIGDAEEYEEIEDSEFIVFINYAYEEAGIADINGEDNSAPVYYNLQGVRVNNPENGLYIVKKGNKVTKQIIRK